MKRDIILSGVGGQGILSIAAVIGRAALEDGLHIKQAEVHGMSQRGGSVITYVRMGEKVYSPMIEQKGADYVLAFEELEALRDLPYLKDGGTLVVNTQHILPLPVIIGAAQYPENILETLRARADVVALDALPMAEAAGNARAVNVVLLGALARRLHFDKALWLDALRACVPARFLESNLLAFESGYNA